MIERIMTFRKTGLVDPPATLAESVNAIHGRTCAVWLRDGLAARAPDIDTRHEPVAEDWGWALAAFVSRDLFVIGCAGEDDADDQWRIMIGDDVSRGLFPWTRKRRAAAAKMVADAVETFLRAQPDVSELVVDHA